MGIRYLEKRVSRRGIYYSVTFKNGKFYKWAKWAPKKAETLKKKRSFSEYRKAIRNSKDKEKLIESIKKAELKKFDVRDKAKGGQKPFRKEKWYQVEERLYRKPIPKKEGILRIEFEMASMTGRSRKIIGRSDKMYLGNDKNYKVAYNQCLRRAYAIYFEKTGAYPTLIRPSKRSYNYHYKNDSWEYAS